MRSYRTSYSWVAFVPIGGGPTQVMTLAWSIAKAVENAGQHRRRVTVAEPRNQDADGESCSSWTT